LNKGLNIFVVSPSVIVLAHKDFVSSTIKDNNVESSLCLFSSHYLFIFNSDRGPVTIIKSGRFKLESRSSFSGYNLSLCLFDRRRETQNETDSNTWSSLFGEFVLILNTNENKVFALLEVENFFRTLVSEPFINWVLE